MASGCPVSSPTRAACARSYPTRRPACASAPMTPMPWRRWRSVSSAMRSSGAASSAKPMSTCWRFDWGDVAEQRPRSTPSGRRRSWSRLSTRSGVLRPSAGRCERRGSQSRRRSPRRPRACLPWSRLSPGRGRLRPRLAQLDRPVEGVVVCDGLHPPRHQALLHEGHEGEGQEEELDGGDQPHLAGRTSNAKPIDRQPKADPTRTETTINTTTPRRCCQRRRRRSRLGR